QIFPRQDGKRHGSERPDFVKIVDGRGDRTPARGALTDCGVPFLAGLCVPDICLTAPVEEWERILLGAAPQSGWFIAFRPKHNPWNAQRGPPHRESPRPCFGSRTSARVAPQQSPILSPANRDYRPSAAGVKRRRSSASRRLRDTP